MGSPETQRARGRWARLAPLLPLLPSGIALLLYAQTLGYGFVWDDPMLSLLPVYSSFDLAGVLLAPANGYEYLPVRDLSLIVDHALYGDGPAGFHASNVLLFAISGALALLLYRRLFEGAASPRLREHAGGLALAGALVFVVHPLQVEPVAFVTARNALLALLLTLCTLLVYLRFLERGGRMLYLGSIALCVAAALSKATAVPLPVLLLAVDLYARREEPLRGALGRVWPHLACVGAIVVVHVAVAAGGPVLHGSIVGGLPERLPRTLFVPQFYLYKLVWPFDLTTEYVLRDLLERLPLLAATTLGSFGLAAFVVWHGARERSLAALLCVAYGLTLVPVLNLLPTHPPVADRYAQLPILFAIPLLLCLAVGVFPRVPERARTRLAAAAAAGTSLLVVGLAVLSHNQLPAWRSSESLFQHAIRVDSRAKLSLGNLAGLAFEDKRTDEAFALLEELERIDPLDRRPDLFRGRRARRNGDFETSERQLRSAIRKQGPLRYMAWVQLGELHRQRGEHAEAAAAFEMALLAAPGEPSGVARLPAIRLRLRVATRQAEREAGGEPQVE